MVRYVQKLLLKHLIIVKLLWHSILNLLLQWRFLIKNVHKFNINMAKSKVVVLRNARNSAGTKLDIWLEYLFLSFLHGVFIMLYIKPYSFISLLIPSSPNIVSRPQNPKSRNVSRYHDFIKTISWFERKWGPAVKIGARVLKFWLDIFFGRKWPKGSF